MSNWRASSQSSNQNVSNPRIKQLLSIFCWLHIFHPRHICSLAPRTSSSVPVILIDSPPNLIGLTWELISSPLPLSVFHQTTDAAARRSTHTHTRVQRMTQCTLMLLIVSVGVNSPPHHADESVLSRMAEYPGPLPSPPPLLRYPSMVYFCPCVSLLSAKCHWRLSLR